MNVPLSWLAEYVKLPESEKALTDRLTMVGHMLDKRKEVDGEVVIDLELRGNRADMFGLIGVARDVSALFHTPLKLPAIAPLPKKDTASGLVTASPAIGNLVKRFMAVRMTVRVGPSPAWLAKRLTAYGIEPINNVVDVTNYVMVETGHPMHAFDADKLTGNGLILRLAKDGERFETIQQGTTLTLSKEDIAIADKKGVQSLTCIGGLHTKVTDATTTILLETAVYNAASCRRTARRHKAATEGGGRHEKFQDPHELPFTLARAIQILEDIANGNVVGGISEYYPNPTKPLSLDFDLEEVKRLSGIEIPTGTITDILEDLGCSVKQKASTLTVVVPTFRTDIEQSADIVEEILRIYGYENIPVKTLSGQLPEPATPGYVLLEEEIRNLLTSMQVNEVITTPLIANEQAGVFQIHGKTFPGSPIRLVNAPDPDRATLRPSLLPNLVDYAKRSLGFRQNRIAFFEVGKIYEKHKKDHYREDDTLSIILGGSTTNTSWNKTPRALTLFDLKGIIEGLLEGLGITVSIEASSHHPSIDPTQEGTITSHSQVIGSFGLLSETIRTALGVKEPLFVAELSLKKITELPRENPEPYTIAPMHPPYIEDLSFTVEATTHVGPMIAALQKIDPLIRQITLLDAYETGRTIRVVYEAAGRTLTAEAVRPLREKLIALAAEDFGAKLKEA